MKQARTYIDSIKHLIHANLSGIDPEIDEKIKQFLQKIEHEGKLTPEQVAENLKNFIEKYHEQVGAEPPTSTDFEEIIDLLIELEDTENAIQAVWSDGFDPIDSADVAIDYAHNEHEGKTLYNDGPASFRFWYDVRQHYYDLVGLA